jgi:hypothetical protein
VVVRQDADARVRIAGWYMTNRALAGHELVVDSRWEDFSRNEILLRVRDETQESAEHNWLRFRRSDGDCYEL